MSHNLTTREDGKVEYMHANLRPWHGLGTDVGSAATAEEAIRAANLGWSVSKRQLMTLDGIDCPEFFAIVRDDNGLPLGMVGPQYKPTQIHEAFSFMDSVTGTANAKYISAGSIGGGKRIFIVAQLPGIVRIKNDDTVERFLTFAHSHDGTLAHRIYLPSIRVVCNNTLDASLKENCQRFYARHTGNLQYRVEEAANVLGFANKSFELFEKQARALAEVVMNVQQVETFIRKVFDVQKGKEEEVSEQKKANIDKVLDNFENGEKNKLNGIAGTAWALLNSVTEFADHQATAVTDDDPERRFNSIMFGSGRDLKETALDVALELVK